VARKRKTEVFSRYDTADYLKTEDEVAAYLEAVMQEAGDDAAFVAQALGTIARARGMVQLAKDTGLTREGLYKALSADGNPSFGTVLKVMKALGLRLEPRRIGEAPPSASKRRSLLNPPRAR
jgi:probable addiction module antidote protein